MVSLMAILKCRFQDTDLEQSVVSPPFAVQDMAKLRLSLLTSSVLWVPSE